MRRSGAGRIGLGIAGAVLFAAGIVGAAEQARPRPFDPELLRTGDIIRYRDLTRADFRAAEPPAETADLHGDLGAATCVFLATDPHTTIRASSDEKTRGLVQAQVENLRFIAILDRDCSWWNPAPMALPDAYILQHEQIHFAIFEIAARALNRRSFDMTRQMDTVSSSQEQAVEEIRRRIDFELQRAMDEVLERSNTFDRDTSRAYRRDRQNWWWEQVRRELEQLEADF